MVCLENFSSLSVHSRCLVVSHNAHTYTNPLSSAHTHFATKLSPENNTTEFVRQLVMANFSLMYPIYFSETYFFSLRVVFVAVAVSSFDFFLFSCVCHRFSVNWLWHVYNTRKHRQRRQIYSCMIIDKLITIQEIPTIFCVCVCVLSEATFLWLSIFAHCGYYCFFCYCYWFWFSRDMPKKKKSKQQKKISDFNGFDFDLIALFDDGASLFFFVQFSWVIWFCFVCQCACTNACFYIRKWCLIPNVLGLFSTHTQIPTHTHTTHENNNNKIVVFISKWNDRTN